MSKTIKLKMDKNTLTAIISIIALLGTAYGQFIGNPSFMSDYMRTFNELQAQLQTTWNPTFYSLTNPYPFRVSKVGSYYCMQNGTTGALKYYSTNLTKTGQFAIDNLTSARTGIEWVQFYGNFTITAPIDVPDYTGINLEQCDIWQGANLTTGVFQSDDYGTGRSDYCIFKGGWLHGVKDTYTTGSAIYGCFRQTDILEMRITSWDDYGIMIESYSGLNADAIRIEDCWIGITATGTGCKNGGIYSKDNGGSQNDWIIDNNFFINNGQFNLQINASGTYRITNNHFAGIAPVGEIDPIGIWLIDSCPRMQVVNNHFENFEYEAILQNGSSYSQNQQINFNTFMECNQNTAYNNTKATICLNSTAANGYIHNSIIGNSFISSQASKAKYCIWLQTNTAHNIYALNQATDTTYAAYFTSAYQSDGTANVATGNLP